MVFFEKAVRKYLAAWAEPEIGLAERVPGRWSHVLVVPACREEPSALDGVPDAAPRGSERLLVILVVNGTEDDEVTAAVNRGLLRSFVSTGVREVRAGECAAHFDPGRGDFDLLLVDRATAGRGLPPRSGVGLARKIGTDVALALWNAGKVASPWLHASDADAIQPRDRFHVRPGEDVVALWHPFIHEPSGEPDLDAALTRYDLSLRYYVNALRWAGSPWAFPTIGSTMTVRADAYAAVRGYPKREAGEDFYLLNKLAKVGSVERANTGPVRLRGRASDRVPFGTGAGIARIRSESAAGEPFRLYHPGSFAVLRSWQGALTGARDLETVPWESALGAGEWAPPPGGMAAAGEAALRALDARARLAALPRAAWQPWFDAFRTLRFLHTVRDAGFPKMEWRPALAEAARLGIAETDYPDDLRHNPHAPPATNPPQRTDIAANSPVPRPASGK